MSINTSEGLVKGHNNAQKFFATTCILPSGSSSDFKFSSGTTFPELEIIGSYTGSGIVFGKPSYNIRDYINTFVFNAQNKGGVKWENGDGYITVEEAVHTWQHGGGKQNLDADITKLDLSKVHTSDFKNGVGSTIWVNFAGKKYYTNPTQAIVYGSISLTLMEGNKVFVPYQDKYDFDIRGKSGSIGRDLLTAGGNAYNGFGTPYWITIYGTTTIKP